MRLLPEASPSPHTGQAGGRGDWAGAAGGGRWRHVGRGWPGPEQLEGEQGLGAGQPPPRMRSSPNTKSDNGGLPGWREQGRQETPVSPAGSGVWGGGGSERVGITQ